MSLQMSGSQTVGPYFRMGLDGLNNDDLAPGAPEAMRLLVTGRVTDGNDAPVPDAMLEVWQANAEGHYAHPEDPAGWPARDGFRGFGRIPTDSDGRFSFHTIRPGQVAGPGGVMQAPHIVVLIFMRGLLKHLMARIYFPGEEANASDPILGLVAAERRDSLIARTVGERHLDWNVRLQGTEETVFFEY